MKNLFALVLATTLATTAVCADDTTSTNSDMRTVRKKQNQMAGKVEEQPKSVSSSTEQLHRADILGKLHHINHFEIELAKIAQEKSQTAAVKDFAQRMITDHQNADKKVVETAKIQGVELRDFQASEHEKSLMDQLNKLEGAQLDEAYLSNAHSEHRMLVELLERMRTDSKDTHMKTLLDGLLPTFRDHEKTALQTQKNL